MLLGAERRGLIKIAGQFARVSNKGLGFPAQARVGHPSGDGCRAGRPREVYRDAIEARLNDPAQGPSHVVVEIDSRQRLHRPERLENFQ